MFQTTRFKNKVLLFIFSFLMLMSSNIWAHNPSHSSMLLAEGENNEWTLLVSSSLTAFQHEIRKKYSIDSYKTSEEFKDLVIKHLMESISIICNVNQSITLEKLAVKLGHGTKVSFKVVGIPKEFNSITVSNNSFENLNNNQSALIILKKEIKKEQFILSKENNHKIALVIKEGEFEVLIEKEIKKSYALLGALVFSLLFIIVLGRKLILKK